jgi:hypothetical protein
LLKCEINKSKINLFEKATETDELTEIGKGNYTKQETLLSLDSHLPCIYGI